MKTIVVLSGQMVPPAFPQGFDRHAWPAQVAPLVESAAGPVLVISYPPFMRAAYNVQRAILGAGTLAERSAAATAYNAWMDAEVDPLLTHDALVAGAPSVSRHPHRRTVGATLTPSMYEHACLRVLALYHARLAGRLRAEPSLDGRLQVKLETSEALWWDVGRSQPPTRPLLVSGCVAVPYGLELGDAARGGAPQDQRPAALLLPPRDLSMVVAAATQFPKAEIIHVGYGAELPVDFERAIPRSARAHQYALNVPR